MYIAFLDINSNANTLPVFIQIRFKYIAIFEIWFKYMDCVSIIVEVYHSVCMT